MEAFTHTTPSGLEYKRFMLVPKDMIFCFNSPPEPAKTEPKRGIQTLVSLTSYL